MTKYLKVDLSNCYGISLCDTKDELFESCGYDVDEITFEELLKRSKDVYEIIEIEGDFKINYLS